MTDSSRKKVKARINRIAGQVNGVARMIDEDRYCLDILDQISAVRSALDSLGVELVTDHLETCLIGAGGETQHCDARAHSPEELLEEVRTSLQRFLK